MYKRELKLKNPSIEFTARDGIIIAQKWSEHKADRFSPFRNLESKVGNLTAIGSNRIPAKWEGRISQHKGERICSIDRRSKTWKFRVKGGVTFSKRAIKVFGRWFQNSFDVVRVGYRVLRKQVTTFRSRQVT